jgi:hypothetical protein
MYGFERKHLVRLSLIIAALVGFVALIVVLNVGPREQLENAFGVTETAFSVEDSTDATVKLDNGSKVVVRWPRGTAFLPGARVELSVQAAGPETMRYYRYKFLGYRNGEHPKE